MVSPQEDHPVVRLPEPSGNLVIDSLVVPRLFETEAAVPGDNEQGILQAVLNAQLEDDALEVPVDVSRYDDLLGLRVFKHCHIPLLVKFPRHTLDVRLVQSPSPLQAFVYCRCLDRSPADRL